MAIVATPPQLPRRRRAPAAATRIGVALAMTIGAALPEYAASSISASELIADVNCDQRSTAADCSAAVIVAFDGARFVGCLGADPFRQRVLHPEDFVPILHDLFDTFEAPWTPTPSASAVATPSGASTRTPTAPPPPSTSPSTTATMTDTPTPLPTPTLTATATAIATRTPTATRTATPSRTATITATPTGLAYQLSGDWAADWTNHICYLDGHPFTIVQDATYRVTAVDGRLDIEIVGGVHLGRALDVDANGTLNTEFRSVGDQICPPRNDHQEFVFEYTFTLHANGIGTGSVMWTYGANTNCAVCTVSDTATLHRIVGLRRVVP